MLHIGKAALVKTTRHLAFVDQSWRGAIQRLLKTAPPTGGYPSAALTDSPHSGPTAPCSINLPLSKAVQNNKLLLLPVHLEQARHSSKMAENKYSADYAKMGTSGCKKCKQKLPKGSFRIAKLVSNPFSEEGGDMKQYHHPRCIFETFVRARAATKIIEETEDLINYSELEDDDKQLVKDLIKETLEKKGTPKGGKKTPAKKTPVKNAAAATKAPAAAATPSMAKPAAPAPAPSAGTSAKMEKDNLFRQFRRMCAEIAEESSYTGKTAILSTFLKKGSSGDGFHGDKYIWLKLLLPGVVKTVYNLNSKQLVKIFAKIFGASESAMVEDLDNGDVAQTVLIFFEQSTICPPCKKSTISIIDVDRNLTELAKYTKEDDQQTVLSMIAKRCTGNDLKMVVRLIKHDLRINSGAKHILDALDPNAYPAFQASRDLRDVIDRVESLKDDAQGGLGSKKLSVRANLMTPILPMLLRKLRLLPDLCELVFFPDPYLRIRRFAEACKSVDYAFKKCPNGMYAEIKYDGERVQVHKQGDNFSYFSRSLKPVLPHKVNHFKDFIPKAFKHGNDLILDAEVLLIDTNTGKPLPFGTLGVHKKAAFQEANVCLFIFDCIHYNGQNLLDKPIKARRKFLQENMMEVPNRILFSEMKHVTEPDDLKDMMMKVFREGLEGLVLKDVNSIYEPGKRHWLKVKKDYLAEGAMADTADLVVLGGYYGTGSKGGVISVFLMGVWDPASQLWCTVTKCGSGFDDKTLDRLQKEFDMVKISKDYTRVPSWLNISRQLAPDLVVKDPKLSQVWEITGAEFSRADGHTAGGISIRFPRCTKMRDDKTWKEATTLPELKELFRASKQTADLPDFLGAGTPKKKAALAESANGSSQDVVKDDVNGTGSGTSPRTMPKKRKSDSHENLVPVKKRSRSEENSSTVKQRSRSEEDSSAVKHRSRSEEDKFAVKQQHLPNVFSGMTFYISTDVHDYDRMKRYIIAFDGDVDEFEKDSATHVVVWNGPMPLSSSQKHVTVEWVWRCIKKKRLCLH